MTRYKNISPKGDAILLSSMIDVAIHYTVISNKERKMTDTRDR